MSAIEAMVWIRCYVRVERFFALVGFWSAVAMLLGCKQRQEQLFLADTNPRKVVDVATVKPQVEKFCGDCHAVPHADTFPQEAWRREVERGFGFYFDSGRQDLAVPSDEEVIGYYEASAPQQLIVTPPTKAVADKSQGRVRFLRSTSDAPQLELPAVSFVDWLLLPNQKQPRHVFCDMRSGLVGVAGISLNGSSVEPLTNLKNPSRVAMCDLDGDGGKEILICDLGSLSSEDHQRGAVVWLQWNEEKDAWRQRLLISGLGRVADVRSGDFDGDGDADLVVAEFGHLRTGRVLMYENQGMERGMPKLQEHVVDSRHGAIHVPVADLNGDGRLDFVALLSQEYEVIEAYVNTGNFDFERRTIFAAGDPAYGSSGIELVDLDGDGDRDVVYGNGDTFGSDYLKPYHGISWLENRGNFPFTEHRLAAMVGVQCIATADLDGDNDRDIVAAAFLPRNLVESPQLVHHDSLIWLEQAEPGRFVRHVLESQEFLHAALAVGDFDNDQDIDLAVGNFQDVEGTHKPWLTIWWNTLAPGDGKDDAHRK